jgi:hypothetical protein
MRNDFTKEIRYGAVILVLGIIVFFATRRHKIHNIVL